MTAGAPSMSLRRSGEAAGVKSGWATNFAHSGDTIFATWFTFGLDGNTLWLVVVKTETTSTFTRLIDMLRPEREGAALLDQAGAGNKDAIDMIRPLRVILPPTTRGSASSFAPIPS